MWFFFPKRLNRLKQAFSSTPFCLTTPLTLQLRLQQNPLQLPLQDGGCGVLCFCWTCRRHQTLQLHPRAWRTCERHGLGLITWVQLDRCDSGICNFHIECISQNQLKHILFSYCDMFPGKTGQWMRQDVEQDLILPNGKWLDWTVSLTGI